MADKPVTPQDKLMTGIVCLAVIAGFIGLCIFVWPYVAACFTAVIGKNGF
jgi:hypothetical protein